MMAGVSASRSFHHHANERCGSVSISRAGLSGDDAMTLRCVASVVFPTPPFLAAIVITRMLDALLT
jgi:hypothetical protein